MCQYDNVPISLWSPVKKSKVESSRVSIYSEHETQNLNSKSRKLSGQILKLIPEPETRNLKIRTLTPPPSGTPLKIRGDHRYAGFSAINNRVEAWSICQCDNMSMCQS